jgi:hypothetical protein
MTRSEVFVGLHVLFASVWIGAAFLMALLGGRVASATRERTLGYVRDSEWLGLRLFLPASVLTLVSGVAAAREGPWGYDDLWIQLGLAAFAASTLIGVLVLGPGWARAAALAAQGADEPEVAERIGRLLVFGWLDVGVVLAAVWVMAVKPGRGDTVALAVVAAVPVLATALGVALRRRVPIDEAKLERPLTS